MAAFCVLSCRSLLFVVVYKELTCIRPIPPVLHLNWIGTWLTTWNQNALRIHKPRSESTWGRVSGASATKIRCHQAASCHGANMKFCTCASISDAPDCVYHVCRVTNRITSRDESRRITSPSSQSKVGIIKKFSSRAGVESWLGQL